jgi:carbamate kinase
MGPKIDAAIRFVEARGRQVLITRAESLADALEGRTGTLVKNRAIG